MLGWAGLERSSLHLILCKSVYYGLRLGGMVNGSGFGSGFGSASSHNHTALPHGRAAAMMSLFHVPSTVTFFSAGPLSIPITSYVLPFPESFRQPSWCSEPRHLGWQSNHNNIVSRPVRLVLVCTYRSTPVRPVFSMIWTGWTGSVQSRAFLLEDRNHRSTPSRPPILLDGVGLQSGSEKNAAIFSTSPIQYDS